MWDGFDEPMVFEFAHFTNETTNWYLARCSMCLPSTWKEVFGYRLIGIGLPNGNELRKSSKRTGEFRVLTTVTLPTGRVNLRTFLRKMVEKFNDFKRKFATHFCIPRVTQQTLSVAIQKSQYIQRFAKMAILWEITCVSYTPSTNNCFSNSLCGYSMERVSFYVNTLYVLNIYRFSRLSIVLNSDLERTSLFHILPISRQFSANLSLFLCCFGRRPKCGLRRPKWESLIISNRFAK